MRLKSLAPQQETNSYNLVVEVSGFGKTPDGKASTVKGTNLVTGEAVEVMLSNKGNLADNVNRKSLADFEKGFKVGPNKYKVEPGGVMSFRAPGWEPKPGEPKIAFWADALAFNKDQAETNLKAGLVTLRVFEPTGKPAHGALTVWHEDKVTSAPTAKELAPAVLAHQKEAGAQAGFLARHIKGQEVVELQILQAAYDKETKQARTPEAATKIIMDKMVAVAERVEADRVDIVPTTRYSVLSAMTASQSGKDQMPKWRGLESLFIKTLDDGDREMLAKKAFFTIGGDNLDFVNDVKPLDPYGPGIDPGLLSKDALRYASALDTPSKESPALARGEPDQGGTAASGDLDDMPPDELNELDAQLDAQLGN